MRIISYAQHGLHGETPRELLAAYGARVQRLRLELREVHMFGKIDPNAAPRPTQSKYGGIECAETRDPMLGLGTYRVRITSCSEGYNPGKRRESYKTTVHVLQASEDATTRPGATCTIVSFMTPAGLAELKRLAIHAAGYGVTLADRASGKVDVRAALIAGEAAYDELDARCGYSGAILEASAGKANGAPSLVGRIVDVIVSRGKDVPNPQTGAPTGDFFRNYVWGVVPESEQQG